MRQEKTVNPSDVLTLAELSPANFAFPTKGC